MAGKYLDGDAVLKELNLNNYEDAATMRSDMIRRVQAGEFDAAIPQNEVEILSFLARKEGHQKRALADKDAEIAGLKEEADKKYVDLVHKYNWLGAQKEPEWFICPTNPNMTNCDGCASRIPHRHPGSCQKTCFCPKCVPVKEPIPQPSPVPTSGTGTAPQVARFLDILNKKGVSAEYNDEDRKKLGEAIWEAFGFVKERTYPGIAKDIGNLALRLTELEDYVSDSQNNGDLILRMDNLKIASEAHEQMFRAHGKMIQDLQQKRLMDDSRGNTFEGQIDRLETALDALQGEVAGIKKNPILSTYDPTPRTFTTTVSDQYTQTGSYNPCQNCQTLAEFNRQHPNGYVGDGYPCNLCPNNPNRVTCSK